MSHHKVRITVNGVAATDEVESRLLLVHYLRETLGLTGTNIGCDTSSCGACTIHVNGESVKSCTMLAAQADGGEILTIEGLASADGTLHPMQQAFIDHDAFQCGCCTPGQIVAADVVRTCEYMYLSLRGLDDHRCCDRIGRGGQLRRH